MLVSIAITAPSTLLQAQQLTNSAIVLQGDTQEYYYADGKPIILREHPSWLVVATDTANQALINELAGAGVALANTQPVRQLSSTLQILEVAPALAANPAKLEQITRQAKSSNGVRWIAPAYLGPDGSWVVATDEVIVRLQPGISPTILTSDARFSRVQALDGTNDQFVVTVAAGGGPPSLALARDLASDSRLAWASPNFYQEHKLAAAPNDPLIGDQWHLRNTGQHGSTVDADADVFEAWDITAGGSSSITIAVIDDGMEYTHPDLAPNLFTNTAEIANNGIDDDGNGWIDDRNGWDFTTNQVSNPVGDKDPGPDPPPAPGDPAPDAHATSVAGVAAARGNNGIGVTGVAYNSRILPVRIFGIDGNSTTEANIASAIYYAAGRTRNGNGTWAAADVLNNSWGGGSPSTAITTALLWATTNGRAGRGTPAFFASGNGGQSSVSYPASLSPTNTGVIAVGASNDDDLRSQYSNAGSGLDIVAPSNDTRSGHFGIVTIDRVGANGYNTGDYTTGGEFGGTSSATPLTAGIAALILARDPNLTAAQVRGLLRNTTDLVGPLAYTSGRNNDYGYGRVNARTAVQSIGLAEVQLLDGVRDLATGDAITLSANINQSTNRTLRIRNQGTATLNLANLSLTGTRFSIVSGFGDTSLSVGESTTIVISFSPVSASAASGSLNFTTNDANEGSFVITLSGITIIPSIAGTVYEDLDKNGMRDSGEPGQAGWTVYLDQNGNGSYDPGSFTRTGEQSIPDNDPVGMSSTLVISGTSATISDLNVRLSISHTYVGDLDIILTGPDGTVIRLINQCGASGDDFTNTVFDDEAPASITTIVAANAPFTASYRPEQALSAFDGHLISGEWRLRVRDSVDLDTGALLSWSLIFGDSGEPTMLTGSNGEYAFTSLAAGNYKVRRLIQNGWKSTAPINAEYNLTLAAGQSITERDFGDAPGYKVYLSNVRKP